MYFEGQKKGVFGEKSMSRAGVKASFAAERLLVVKHCVNPPRDASGGTKHVLATKLNKKAFGKTELRQKHLVNFLGATWGLFPPRVGVSTCEGRRPGWPWGQPELASPPTYPSWSRRGKGTRMDSGYCGVDAAPRKSWRSLYVFWRLWRVGKKPNISDLGKHPHIQ